MSDSSQEDQQMARDCQLFLIMHEKIPEGQKIKKIIECLEGGANISAVNKRGKTILDIAIKKNYKHIIRFLQKRMDGDMNASSKDDSSQSKDHSRYNNDVVTSKSVNSETKSESANDDNSKNFLDRLEIFREGMSQHGVLFQLKLLMLVLWRATANQFSQFRLATELSEGEKFDDVVLQYRKESSAKWKCRLLQAKHKENSEDKFSMKLKKIEGLFGCDDKAFSLQKYFRSYLKIKQKTATPSPYSIFFQNEIEDVVIITNTDFKVSDRKYFEKVDLDLQTDKIFRLEDKENKFKNAAIYKPSKDSGILEKCIPIFENTSDYFTLIEILVEWIVKGETNRKNDNILKEYYYPLTKSLFEIKEDSKAKLHWKKDCPFIDSLIEEITFVTLFNGKKIKMSADIRNKMFVDDLKESVTNSAETVQTLEKLAENVADAVKNEQKLDRSLVTKFQKFIEEFLDVNNETLHPIFVHGNLKGNKLSDEMKLFRRTFIKHLLTEEQKQETKRKLEGKELKILEKFDPVDQPIIQEVSEFAKQMRKLIVQNRETKIIEINKKTLPSIRENLQMLSGFLIAEKFGKIRFCSTFLASKKLPESLQEFKEEFSTLLGQEFKEIYRYEFQMKGCDFKTCIDGTLETELPILHNSDNIIEFFGKLKFIVNYPNRVEIDDQMEKNIREKFKIVDGKAFNSMYVEGMHNWMANSIGTFFMPDQANKMFKDISNNLSLWTVDGITKVYFADVPKEFQFRDSNDFVEFLRNKKRVLIISTQNLQLTRIRIVQTFLKLQQKDLKEFMKYTRGFGQIFLNLKQIDNPDFCSYVLNQIESSKELKLVVIECNEGKRNSELCEQFFGLINTKKEIKIVLIVPDKNLIVNIPNKFKQECSDMSNFEDLNNKSKLKFLSEKITFQGQQTTFNDILGNDKTGNVFCHDILCRMIEKKDVSIGSIPPLSKGYQENFYIERNIRTKVYVDLKILKDEDTVVVNEYEEEFIEKSEKFPKKNVHWFKKEEIKLTYKNSDVLAWQKTKGWISNVLKYRVYEYVWNKESVEKYDIANDKNDVVIIADLAGMGKSTLLSSLTIKMKDRLPDRWLFRIDLNDCTSVLSEELLTKKYYRNYLDRAKDLFKKMLACSPSTKLDTEQEEKLFSHNLSFTKKIIVLLDGVDEISPTYTKIMIELIQALRGLKLEKIVITTRSNVAKELERQLNIFSYSLETFSEDNQITFLTKFWKKNFLEHNTQCYKQNVEKRLNLYAKSLITKMSTLIVDRQRSFTGIPLQLMMLAEIFQNVDHGQEFEGCFQFLTSNESEPKLPDKLNLHDLYSMFIKKKYRIYSEEKKKDFRSNLGVEEDSEMLHKMYQEYHRTLALYAFFEERDLKILLDISEYETFVKNIKNFIENIEDGKERRGIIDQVIKNKPKFIHRTFMEYFVAEFVVDAMLIHKINETRVEFIITSIFDNDNCIVIRSFINNLFLQQKLLKCEFFGCAMDSVWQKDVRRFEIKMTLETACEENNQEIVRFILSSLKNYSSTKRHLYKIMKLSCLVRNLEILKIFVENDFNLPAKDDAGCYTILHHACTQQCLDTVLWLLNRKCTDVNSRDSYDRTPLFVTIESGSENSLDIVNVLVKHGADINAHTKSGSQPLHGAALLGSINITNYLIDCGASVNSIDFNGWTLLHCAARSGQREFCKWLLKNHKAEMNPKNKAGQTPLHVAVEWYKVDIIKLLVEHGADVNTRDEKGFQPLHTAANGGRIDLAQHLLESDANINCKSFDDSTLLHCAAKWGRIEFCKWLLNDHKVEVNPRRKDGETPLQLAVEWGKSEICKILLQQSGKMYPLHTTNHDYFIKFILKSHPALFAPLTFENFQEKLNFEEINWDGTVDLIEYLTRTAETLINERVDVPE